MIIYVSIERITIKKGLKNQEISLSFSVYSNHRFTAPFRIFDKIRTYNILELEYKCIKNLLKNEHLDKIIFEYARVKDNKTYFLYNLVQNYTGKFILKKQLKDLVNIMIWYSYGLHIVLVVRNYEIFLDEGFF